MAPKRRSPRKFPPPVGFLAVNKLVRKAMKRVENAARAREWGRNNRERATESHANWVRDNHERACEIDRNYHERNREDRLSNMRDYDALHLKEANERRKVRRQATETRIMENLRGRLRTFVRRKGTGKQENTAKSVGCSPNEAVDHLEQQLNPGEHLDDMDIDHIFPCDCYDFNIEGQQKKGFNYKNMQPLSPRENRQKWNKLPTKAMAAKVPRELWPDDITEDMLPDIYPGWTTPLRM
jgi:5-methylcytosine-specific restriction endonuclease McrA